MGVAVPIAIKTLPAAVAADDTATEVAATREKRGLPAAPVVDLRLPGRLRVEDVLAVLRVSRTMLWDGIKDGTYPKADYHEKTVPFWKHSTILKVIEK